MPSNIWLIDSANVAYYLSGPGPSTVYNGSGTPWTVQATSPIQLSLNEKTGQSYTPQAPEPVEVYGGGPPFAIGSELVSRGYGNVVEEFGLQIRASTHNNAVHVKRLLNRVLKQSLWTRPAILAVQPNGATNIVYFNIYGGKIQESGSFINEEAGTSPQLVRCSVIWQRSPFGGLLTTPETLLSAVTMGNNGTGSPDNVEVFGTGSGDMITEGSPLNISIRNAVDVIGAVHFYVAVVNDRTYASLATAITTSSTTGITVATANPLFTSYLTTKRRPRVLLRFTSPSSNLQVRIQVYVGTGATATVYTSPWIAANGGATSPTATLIDMGTWEDLLDQTIVGGNAYTIRIQARSTTGAATSGTLAAIETLDYYTFCEIIGTDPFPNDYATYIDTFRQRSGFPCLPQPPTSYGYDATGNQIISFERIRGAAPHYISSASLWIAQFISTNYDTNTANTFTVTATHAPLYETLRGNG